MSEENLKSQLISDLISITKTINECADIVETACKGFGDLYFDSKEVDDLRNDDEVKVEMDKFLAAIDCFEKLVNG